MGRKVFAWSVPKKNKREGCIPRKNPQLVEKSETEGFIIAAQGQCIKTNYYRNKILKDGTDQCAEFVGNFNKQLTTLSPDALNLPRQSTYKDTIKLQHISTGQYANTITSKHKINTTNLNQLL